MALATEVQLFFDGPTASMPHGRNPNCMSDTFGTADAATCRLNGVPSFRNLNTLLRKHHLAGATLRTSTAFAMQDL